MLYRQARQFASDSFPIRLNTLFQAGISSRLYVPEYSMAHVYKSVMFPVLMWYVDQAQQTTSPGLYKI